MPAAIDFLASVVLVVAASACSVAAPGMTVVKSSGAASGPGAMLVAFPPSPCTGTNSAVFMDEKGGFVGAVAPGTATYVAFPAGASRLFVVSSSDVEASPGTWFRRHEIAAPSERVESGIVVEVGRRDAKNCYARPVPSPQVVTYAAATHAAQDLTWLDADADAGNKWLGEHRIRLAQLLEKPPVADPAALPRVTTITRLP